MQRPMADPNAGPPGPNVGVEPLLKEAESASRHVNTVHLTFLLFAAYVLVTIASTTHEQLLRIDPVTLPLLNVSVPILGFYLVVPWLVLLFHFNLLLQLYLLSRKLFVLDARLASLGEAAAEHRVLLFPFPFTNMLIGRQHRLVHVLLTLMVTVTFVIVPLTLLIGAQIAFLPFHSVTVTAFQRLVVHLDLAILWILWPMIVSPSGSSTEWWRACRSKARNLAGQIGRLRRLFKRRGRALPAPPSSSAAKGSSSPWLATLGLATAGAVSLSFLIAVLPGEALEQWIARAMPERWVVRGGTCPDGCWVVTSWACDRWEAPFPRNLHLANTVLVEGEIPPATLTRLRARPDTQRRPLRSRDFALPDRKQDVESIQGLDLTNRDLRFADLRGAVLIKADLRGANLTGADLQGADLSAADLVPFDTREGERCLLPPMKPPFFVGSVEMEAPACRTVLSKANLTSALLPWARLEHADLSDATAWDVVFVEAHLYEARLDRAALFNALAYRADLSRASLRRSTLTQADLRLTELGSASLQGANLEGAKLHGADLGHASFDGAWLRGTGLWVVRAHQATFRGTDLRFADLTGADLVLADFEGADLRGASIGSAELRHADLGWADLRYLGRTRWAQPLKSDTIRAIGDEGDLEELPHLLDRIGKPDTLTYAIRLFDALCDDPKLRADCLSQDRVDLYGTEASKLLASLGCEDADVAAGIVRRLVARNSANYDRIEWSSIAEDALAKALLDPTCKSRPALSNVSRWVLRRAARGLQTPPWAAPREIVYPQGIYQTLNMIDRETSLATHVWRTDSRVFEVAEYYRSKPEWGAWRIEPASSRTDAQAVFHVSHRDDPSRTFATITVSSVSMAGRARIEIALHEPQTLSDVPTGIFD